MLIFSITGLARCSAQRCSRGRFSLVVVASQIAELVTPVGGSRQLAARYGTCDGLPLQPYRPWAALRNAEWSPRGRLKSHDVRYARLDGDMAGLGGGGDGPSATTVSLNNLKNKRALLRPHLSG